MVSTMRKVSGEYHGAQGQGGKEGKGSHGDYRYQLCHRRITQAKQLTRSANDKATICRAVETLKGVRSIQRYRGAPVYRSCLTTEKMSRVR
jgi:hypothetical protein